MDRPAGGGSGQDNSLGEWTGQQVGGVDRTAGGGLKMSGGRIVTGCADLLGGNCYKRCYCIIGWHAFVMLIIYLLFSTVYIYFYSSIICIEYCTVYIRYTGVTEFK